MRSAIASAMLTLVDRAAAEGAAVRFGIEAKSLLEQACSYLERAQQAGGDEKVARAWGRLALAFARKAAGAAENRGRPQVCQPGVS